MKNLKLIVLGTMMAGVMLTSAQVSSATSTNLWSLWNDSVHSAQITAEAREQGTRIAAAADYLKLALVLGLGMIIGRMSAISHRELTELKAALAGHAKNKSE